MVALIRGIFDINTTAIALCVSVCAVDFCWQCQYKNHGITKAHIDRFSKSYNNKNELGKPQRENAIHSSKQLIVFNLFRVQSSSVSCHPFRYHFPLITFDYSISFIDTHTESERRKEKLQWLLKTK